MTEGGIVSPPCDNLKISLWIAFSSLVTIEHIEEHSVGFLLVVPHPVTDYATVSQAMDNVLDMLTELDQTSLTHIL